MTLLWRKTLGSMRDLAPVVLIILFFQVVVLQQPVVQLQGLLAGAVLVVVGLTLIVYGLELALFPLGESLANALARKGSFPWLIAFAFLLGFGTAFAEPALTAVASEAATTAAGVIIADSEFAKEKYALGLRIIVALGVGLGLVTGVTRIVLGWPLSRLVIGGYVLVIVLSLVAPPETIGVAYDSGGVTTSVVTVPLVTALGIGLASSLSGRSPMADGFGIIALVIIAPMILVMAYGTLVAWI